MKTNLYSVPYHSMDISQHKFLVTGGAGFIGSNIVEYLLTFGAGHVRVLDNLSNGYVENINEFKKHTNFEFIHGDIRDFDTCVKAVEGIDFISHQAALGSVPRSIQDPINSNSVNVSGFLNMLVAAKESKSLKRMIYAASSSTYGDSKELPKVEGREGKPLSPYAVTKAVNEYYAEVFSMVYGFHTIGLRYFNVFGPRQNPKNPYAAVIPIFCKNFLDNNSPTINGDGETSRDFTFVENAVQANIRTLLFGQNEKDELNKHEVFNVACGDQVTLNEMIVMLQSIAKKENQPIYGPERPGDVRHSRAQITKSEEIFGYSPRFRFEEGLELVYQWYGEQDEFPE